MNKSGQIIAGFVGSRKKNYECRKCLRVLCDYMLIFISQVCHFLLYVSIKLTDFLSIHSNLDFKDSQVYTHNIHL